MRKIDIYLCCILMKGKDAFPVSVNLNTYCKVKKQLERLLLWVGS